MAIAVDGGIPLRPVPALRREQDQGVGHHLAPRRCDPAVLGAMPFTPHIPPLIPAN